MKLEVSKGSTVYELNLLQITQLCGKNIMQKSYIIESLCKHFSGAKYAEYELEMQDNIFIDGKKAGRKYFSSNLIKSRADLIGMIKLTKNSLMMKYLAGRLTEFECQKELDAITEHLEKIYIEINKELETSLHNIEISYEQKNFLEMLQSSMILGKEERELEQLSNYELIETYIDLLWKMQEKKSEKYLVVFENIDHFLTYQEYLVFYEKIRQFCYQFDVWFVLSSSIGEFAVLEREYLQGVHIINDIIYILPEEEKLYSFVVDRYPYLKKLDIFEILEGVRRIVHNIGQENYCLDLQSQIFLKLVNDSLCVRCAKSIGINAIENGFILDRNTV